MNDIKLEPGLDVILTFAQSSDENKNEEESDKESWLFFMYICIIKLYNIYIEYIIKYGYSIQ